MYIIRYKLSMRIVVIGGLTNGQLLIDYFRKKKDIKIELVITHPYKKNTPRIINFKYLKKLGIRNYFLTLMQINISHLLRKLTRI